MLDQQYLKFWDIAWSHTLFALISLGSTISLLNTRIDLRSLRTGVSYCLWCQPCPTSPKKNWNRHVCPINHVRSYEESKTPCTSKASAWSESKNLILGPMVFRCYPTVGAVPTWRNWKIFGSWNVRSSKFSDASRTGYTSVGCSQHWWCASVDLRMLLFLL